MCLTRNCLIVLILNYLKKMLEISTKTTKSFGVFLEIKYKINLKMRNLFEKLIYCTETVFNENDFVKNNPPQILFLFCFFIIFKTCLQLFVQIVFLTNYFYFF